MGAETNVVATVAGEAEVMEVPQGTTGGNDAAGNPLATSKEDIEYVVTRVTGATDGKYSFAEYKEGNNLAKSVSEGKVEVLRKITISVPFAHSLAGISELVPDEEEAVNIWNRGAAAKLGNKFRTRFLETNEAGDFVNTEEVYDASEDLASPTNRRGLTDAQKLLKNLKEVPADVLADVLRSMGILN